MYKRVLYALLSTLFLMSFLLSGSPGYARVQQKAAMSPANPAVSAAQQAIRLAYPQGLAAATKQAAPDQPSIMPPNPGLKDRIARGEVKVPTFTDDPAQWINRSGTLAGGPEKAPLSGTIRVLVVLVDFSDQVHTVTASYFDSLMFSTPVSGRGSVRDYFNDVSYGTVDIVTVNMPSNMGWVRAPQTKAAYLSGGNNCMGTYPNNCQKLAEDVADAIHSTVDFSLYDNNGDGQTEPIVIVHSGPGAEFSGSNADIWSHSWGMRYPKYYNGKTIQRYTIQPEYWQPTGVNPNTSDMTIGVFCHEMGHGFWSLPDLYDTDNSSQGIGSWSLMAGGSWNGHLSNGTYGYYMGDSPAWPDAWSRIQMGFATATYLGSNKAGLPIPMAYGNAPSASTIYKLRSSVLNSSEYFLIENREKTTNTYDEYLPGQGLLIWHIDDSQTSNKNECKTEPHSGCASTHYWVGLEQADGQRHMENNIGRGDTADSYPGTGTNRTFNLTSHPESSSYYTSGNPYITITNISDAGANMTANVTVGLDVPGSLSALPVSATQVNLNWTDTSYDETNFRIERSSDGGTYSEIAAPGANSTFYSDTGVSCGHSYLYRVRAYRSLDGGSYSNYSSEVSASTPACQLPGPFAKTNPTPGTANLPIKGLSLNWDPSSGATSYQYCYSLNPACPGSWTSTTALSAPLDPLTPGATYYWQVRAHNNNGDTDATGGWWSFSTLPAPGSFAKIDPSNGATDQVLNGLSLKWESSSSAAYYQYCYSTSSTSCTGAWTDTTATTAPLPKLDVGTHYYWQVRAINDSGTTDATSGLWSFTTAYLPQPFSKTAPADGATGQPTNGLKLTWGASTGAAYYEYCYNQTATCPRPWTKVNGTSASPDPLMPGTTYFWQVRAVSPAGSTDAASGWFSFKTVDLPKPFSKLGPDNLSTEQPVKGLVLTWETSGGASSYEYCLSGADGVCPNDEWTSTEGANSATLPFLGFNKTYYWQVRARNADGSTEALDGWWRFTTLVPYPFYIPSMMK